MKSITFIIAAFISLFASSSALAQNTIFEDDFSNGIGAWTADDPWHLADINTGCSSQSNGPPSYGNIARVGDADCTFESICPPLSPPCFSYRTMVITNSITIPAGSLNPRIEFDSFIDAEFAFDVTDVIIFVDGDPNKYVVGADNDRGSWHSVSMDLSPWIGEQVHIGFFFYPLDGVDNDGLGWLVDNVQVLTDGNFYNYCIAAANSFSASGAIIGHTGSLLHTQNNFSLTVQGAPPGQLAIFFYGPSYLLFPMGQGYLCVMPDQFGYRRLFPNSLIDLNGDLTHPVNFTTLTGSHTILPGTQVNFQCWYRDVSGTSNFSDAQSVTFIP